MIRTIRGPMEEADLRREVVFKDLTKEFQIHVEYYASDGELVRNDAHVVLKEPSLTADALAAAIG